VPRVQRGIFGPDQTLAVNVSPFPLPAANHNKDKKDNQLQYKSSNLKNVIEIHAGATALSSQQKSADHPVLRTLGGGLGGPRHDALNVIDVMHRSSGHSAARLQP
jgi:hypothetical protein